MAKAYPVKLIEEKCMALLTGPFGAAGARAGTDAMLWAETNGIGNQGFVKLTGGSALQNIVAKGEPAVSEPAPCSVLVKANNTINFYATEIATQAVLQKAKTHGFAVAGVNDTANSNGAIGYYAERLAREGLIAIVMAGSPSSVAPYGIKPPLTGTNPMAVAFPTNDTPLMFDMATAAITWYGLVLANMRGEKIPDDVAIDADGNATTDPAAAMDGAILAFDRGPKSSNLSLMVEVMTGPLVGAAYCDDEFTGDWGTFILAFKPDLLVPLDKFKTATTDLLAKLRAKPTRDGAVVRLPGDGRAQFAAQVAQTGTLTLDDEVANALGLTASQAA